MVWDGLERRKMPVYYQQEILSQLTLIRESQVRMEDQLGFTKSIVQEHSLILNGNGKDGLKDDVRSLKQTAKQQTCWYGAVGLLCLKTLWEFLTKGGH